MTSQVSAMGWDQMYVTYGDPAFMGFAILPRASMYHIHILFLYTRLVRTYYGMARASVCSVYWSVNKACKHDTD